MNPIDRSARYLACSIRRNYPDAGSEKALFYSLSLLINSAVSISTTLLIAFATDRLIEAVTVILGYFILRYVSGGVHAGTSLSCCLLSIAIFTAAAHSTFAFWPIGVVLNGIAILILLITAPNNIEKISRIDPKYYKHLKLISVLLVASNFFFQSPVLAAAFITQAFLTTRLGHKFISCFGKEETT